MDRTVIWVGGDRHGEVFEVPDLASVLYALGPVDLDRLGPSESELLRQLSLPIRSGRWMFPGRTDTVRFYYVRMPGYDLRDAVMTAWVRGWTPSEEASDRDHWWLWPPYPPTMIEPPH